MSEPAEPILMTHTTSVCKYTSPPFSAKVLDALTNSISSVSDYFDVIVLKSSDAEPKAKVR